MSFLLVCTFPFKSRFQTKPAGEGDLSPKLNFQF